MIALFVLCLGIGLLLGFWRGTRKALIKLATVAVAFLLALFFTPLITNVVLGFAAPPLIKALIPDNLATLSAYLSERMGLAKSVVGMLVNPIMFLVVFLVFWALSLIVYAIVCFATKKGKDKGKDKSKDKAKGKSKAVVSNKPEIGKIGMLFGALSGFLMFLVLLIPINGYLEVASYGAKIENESVQSVYSTAKKSGFDVAGYGKLPFTVGLDKVCFDYLASGSYKPEGAKKATSFTLKKEGKAVIAVVTGLDGMDANNMLADTEGTRALVETAFKSKLVNVIADDFVGYLAGNPGQSTAFLKEVSIDDIGGIDVEEFEDLLVIVLPALKDNGVKNSVFELLDVMEVFATLNSDDPLADTAALREALGGIFESKFVNTVVDDTVGYMAENPAQALVFLQGMAIDNIGGLDLKQFDELLPIIFTELKGNGVKKSVFEILDAVDAFAKVDTEDPLKDTEMLREVLDDIFGSEDAPTFVGSLLKEFIEFAADNPDKQKTFISALSLDMSATVDFMEFDELLGIIFDTMRDNGIKKSVVEVLDSLDVLTELDIDFVTMEINAIADLSDETIDKLVDALIAPAIMKGIVPHLMPSLLKPIADQMGIEKAIEHPVLSDEDWAKENALMKGIFKKVGAVNALTDLSDQIDDPAKDRVGLIEEYFEDSSDLGALMDELKVSKLFGGLYSVLTEFDTEDQEYFIVTYFDNLIIQSSGDAASAGNAVRKLFTQETAKKAPSTPDGKDTIDFAKFSWSELMGQISDTVKLASKFSKALDELYNADGLTDIADLIRELKDQDPEIIQALIETLIPEGVDVTIPDLSEVDFEKEAEIYEELLAYQDQYNEDPESIGQDDVDAIVGLLAESDLVVPMLASAEGEIGIAVDEDQQAMVEQAIENNGITDEDLINQIRAIFGMPPVGAEPEPEPEPEE